MERGILLDGVSRDMLELLPEDDGVFLIGIVSEVGLKNDILTKGFFDENIKKIKALLDKYKGQEFSLGLLSKLGYFFKGEVSEIDVSKRSLDKNNKVKIISAPAFIKRKIVVSDFIKHFKNRYERIREMLEVREFENLTSIRKIGRIEANHTIIVAVVDKKITKNKNILLEVEDLTGTINVLINNNKTELFKIGKNILKDDIVAIKTNGNSDILFAEKVIYPEAFLNEKKYMKKEGSVAFISDLHIGSKMFLEENFLKFIKWLNCESDNERQRELAKGVSYLFIAGDAVDGVNHGPGQEKYLDIKTTVGQYKKLEDLLRLVRKDVQIVMCPGQHDAVWVGEPQPIINKKFASGLHKMDNLMLVPNPSLVDIQDGFKILMYHGASISYFINELSELRTKHKHNSPTRVVGEMLKRRHFAPLHGLADYIPCEEDSLVINEIPDILFTGDQHRAEISTVNNILLIAGSCWQSITPFEEKVGNNPDPCKVPIFNLKTREIKILDFNDLNNEEAVEEKCGEEVEIMYESPVREGDGK